MLPKIKVLKKKLTICLKLSVVAFTICDNSAYIFWIAAL